MVGDADAFMNYFEGFYLEGITPENNKLMSKVWEMTNSQKAIDILMKMFDGFEDGTFVIPASVVSEFDPQNSPIPLDIIACNFFMKYGKSTIGLTDSDISYISKYKDLLTRLYKETGVGQYFK